jgi:hypothetical protein
MSISGGLLADARARKVEISAVIHRADGAVERRGMVAYWHRNPLLRAVGNFRVWLKERMPK